jgi:AraC-like DNA-binding protein/predicted transcriptional regulator YdeE
LSGFYLERIRRGVDFIEAHLDEDVSLAAVARAAGVSQWHFQRIFKSVSGETLKGYIRARRMASALHRLLHTDLRVVDIAVLAGFESQEAFARAFKQAFGLTPMAYRRAGHPNMFLEKLALDDDMLHHLQANVTREPELVRQASMDLVGLRTVFFGVDSEKNNLGEKLPPLWAEFLPRRFAVPNASTQVCYGVLRQDRDDPERLEYLAAVRVHEPGELPAGMARVQVPAATYARFEHRGPAPALDRTVSYAYSTWLLRSGRRHTYGPDLEIYDDRYHPTAEDSVVSFAMPVED